MSDAPGLSIVVIDDDDNGRRMLRRALERRGHTIAEAVNGELGLATIRETQPNLVLVDLRMPGLYSGLDVVRLLRENTATADLPVIVVSASAHSDARELATKVGANGFVEKPVDFPTLFEAIAQVLR